MMEVSQPTCIALLRRLENRSYKTAKYQEMVHRMIKYYPSCNFMELLNLKVEKRIRGSPPKTLGEAPNILVNFMRQRKLPAGIEFGHTRRLKFTPIDLSVSENENIVLLNFHVSDTPAQPIWAAALVRNQPRQLSELIIYPIDIIETKIIEITHENIHREKFRVIYSLSTNTQLIDAHANPNSEIDPLSEFETFEFDLSAISMNWPFDTHIDNTNLSNPLMGMEKCDSVSDSDHESIMDFVLGDATTLLDDTSFLDPIPCIPFNVQSSFPLQSTQLKNVPLLSKPSNNETKYITLSSTLRWGTTLSDLNLLTK